MGEGVVPSITLMTSSLNISGGLYKRKLPKRKLNVFTN